MATKVPNSVHERPVHPYQGIYEQSSEQKYALGTEFRPGDGSGRRFVYCKAGAVALAKGKMCQAPAIETAFTSSSLLKAKTSNLSTVTLSRTAKTTSGGSTTIASISASKWAGGNVVDNGNGVLRRIVSHVTADEVTGSFATTTCTGSQTITQTLKLKLTAALTTALTGAETVSFVKNPYNAVIVVPSGGASGAVVGVPLVAVTASYYFWLQVDGRAPLLVDTGETLAEGDWIGEPHAGAVDGAAGAILSTTVNSTTGTHSITTDIPLKATRPAWGKVVQEAGADAYAIVNLQLGVM